MKRRFELFLVCFFVSGGLILLFAGENSPQGRVLEGLAMKSVILGQEIHFAVYLPPDYEISTRRYPVVYLLHGFADNESGWIQFGEINLTADRAIEAREIPPMIIVMPDGGVTWYINDHKKNNRFEDAFVQEFIPYIDATYRIRSLKEFRGISGLSMGGWGSLMLAMRHPDIFAACAAFSSAVFTDDEVINMPDDRYDRLFAELFGRKLKGEKRINNHWRQYHPLDLVKTLPAESLKKVRWYIDCGDDDFLSKGNATLHIVLREREIPHEYRVRDGAHRWEYWRTGITEGLKFIGQSFHR